MNTLEQAKVKALIEQAMETRILLLQMVNTIEQLEKELRRKLNESWEVIQ